MEELCLGRCLEIISALENGRALRVGRRIPNQVLNVPRSPHDT